MTVVLEAEHDPAGIGGVAADECVDLPAGVVRQVVQPGFIGCDRGDVGGVAGVREVGVVGEERCCGSGAQSCLIATSKAERRELQGVAAVDPGGVERLSEVESVVVTKLSVLPSGETFGSVTPLSVPVVI